MIFSIFTGAYSVIRKEYEISKNGPHQDARLNLYWNPPSWTKTTSGGPTDRAIAPGRPVVCGYITLTSFRSKFTS